MTTPTPTPTPMVTALAAQNEKLKRALAMSQMDAEGWRRVAMFFALALRDEYRAMDCGGWPAVAGADIDGTHLRFKGQLERVKASTPPAEEGGEPGPEIEVVVCRVHPVGSNGQSILAAPGRPRLLLP